jgi:hypothetical protein
MKTKWGLIAIGLGLGLLGLAACGPNGHSKRHWGGWDQAIVITVAPGTGWTNPASVNDGGTIQMTAIDSRVGNVTSNPLVTWDVASGPCIVTATGLVTVLEGCTAASCTIDAVYNSTPIRRSSVTINVVDNEAGTWDSLNPTTCSPQNDPVNSTTACTAPRRTSAADGCDRGASQCLWHCTAGCGELGVATVNAPYTVCCDDAAVQICGSATVTDNERTAVVITVTQGADLNYQAATSPPVVDSGDRYAYPGVTCYLANGRILITSAIVSPDGKTITLTYSNSSGVDFGMVWLLLDSAGATLTTDPAIDGNAAGDKVFVIGPLANGASHSLALSFDAFTTAGYTVALNFLDVRPRIVYSSDRAALGDEVTHNPESIRTLYSLDRTLPDLFTVTPTTTRDLNPVWSPGGEWIAFERMTPTVVPSGDIRLPTQINLIHPDGSEGGYGGRINHDLYLTSSATFNPTGELLAFAGRLYDEDNPDTTYNVYLYDIKTGAKKIWFPGAPYDMALICNPKWSPDGQYVVMNTLSGTGVIRWWYARVDPLTGDTIPLFDSLGNRVTQPVVFESNGLVKVNPDGTKHQLKMQEWHWAPDSRHVAVLGEDVRTVGVVQTTFAGQSIIDFQSIIDTKIETLPQVPDVVTYVAYGGDGECRYAGFDPAGSQLWFYRTVSSANSLLQYTPLTNYAPTPPAHQRTTFLSDGFYNFTAALWTPARPEFFPPLP